MSMRILIADDHRILRESLRHLIDEQQDFEVVGEAEDGITAMKMAGDLRPDVLIMDIGMPRLNGIDAARKIRAELPHIKIIALSMHAESHVVAEMLKAGASGYILKDAAIEELVCAIRECRAGRIYLSPSLAENVIKDYISHFPRKDFSVYSLLTSREREVLQLIAEGKTTQKIASLLFISPKTVETHRQNIMDKLNLHSIAELTKYAIREGLTPLEG